MAQHCIFCHNPPNPRFIFFVVYREKIYKKFELLIIRIIINNQKNCHKNYSNRIQFFSKKILRLNSIQVEYKAMKRQFNITRLTLPGVIGNILEWYEFSLYAYFATSISQQFFPNQNKFLSLLYTFGIFAIGYLMRPLGAMLFGYFGDRLGRKKILSISIISMALSTTAIGLIPNYEKIGAFAGILLISCRLLQGLAVGGEYTSSAVYLIEQAPSNQRGLWGSLALLSAYSGLLLGSLIGAIVSYMAEGTSYQAIAWRIPFLLGSLLGIIGFYIRSRMPETKNFITAQIQNKLLANPLWHILRYQPALIIKGIALNLLPAVTSYLLFAYLPTYISQYNPSINSTQILISNTLAMLVMLIMIPIVGHLSDRLNRHLFLFCAPMLLLIFSYPLFYELLHGSIAFVFVAQALLGIILCSTEAVIPALLADTFPVDRRCTGIGLSLNISNGVFGGTAPIIATFLIHYTHKLIAPSFYLLLIAAISLLITLFVFKRSYFFKKNLIMSFTLKHIKNAAPKSAL